MINEDNIFLGFWNVCLLFVGLDVDVFCCLVLVVVILDGGVEVWEYIMMLFLVESLEFELRY